MSSCTEDGACPWCPASPVLDGQAQSHRSLTKTVFKPSLDSKEEISFSDASASPCKDEKEEIIAAVKFVKDVTPQVYSAYLASDLFLFQDESDVLKKTVEYFRKMFRADYAKVALRSKSGQFSIWAEASKDNQSGAIVTEIPINISSACIMILESCPSEVDIIESGAERDKADCLFWNDYCIPESPNPSIKEIAHNFNLKRGLIVPIKMKASLYGLILIYREKVFSPNNFTQLDVLYAQMASQIASVALERMQIFQAQNATLQQFQETTRISDDLQALCSDIVTTDDYDQIIALSLTGITCNLGLKYARAIFLKLENSHLIFHVGIGPITSEEATKYWANDKINNIKDYYKIEDWCGSIHNNKLSRLGKAQLPIALNEIQDSAIMQSIEKRQTIIGEVSDAFVEKTNLAGALRIDKDFVVSPVYSGSIMHGVIIADKKYLDNEHISVAEIAQLPFLTAFTGAYLTSSRLDKQIRSVPLLFMMHIHRIIENKYHEKGVNVNQLVALTEKLAAAVGLSSEEIETAKLTAYAVNFAHLSFPESILFGDDKISKDDKCYKYIREHPETAWQLLKIIGGSEMSSLSALQHHVLFDGYPAGHDSDLTTIAKILAIAECYISLINPKEYKKTSPRSPKDAISVLRKEVQASDKETKNMVDQLSKIVTEEVIA